MSYEASIRGNYAKVGREVTLLEKTGNIRKGAKATIVGKSTADGPATFTLRTASGTRAKATRSAFDVVAP